MFSQSYSRYLQKDYQNALDLLTNAQQQRKQTKGSLEHINVNEVIYWNDLACIYLKLKQFHLAEFYFTRVLSCLPSLFNNNTPLEAVFWCGDILYNAGVTALLLGKAALALKCFEECMQWSSLQRYPRLWLRAAEAAIILHTQHRQRVTEEKHLSLSTSTLTSTTSNTTKHNKHSRNEEITQQQQQQQQQQHQLRPTFGHKVVSFRRLLTLCNERAQRPHHGGKLFLTSPFSLPSLLKLVSQSPLAAHNNSNKNDNDNKINNNNNNNNNNSHILISFDADASRSEQDTVNILQYARRCLINALLLLDKSSTSAPFVPLITPLSPPTPTVTTTTTQLTNLQEERVLSDQPPRSISEETRICLLQVTWTYFAWVSLELDDPLTAYSAASEVLKYSPTTPHFYYAHLYAAEAQCWLNNIPAARSHLLTLLEKLTSPSPTATTSFTLSQTDVLSLHCSLYVNLAVCHILDNEYNAAYEALSKALALNGDYTPITLLQLYLDLRQGHLEHVLELLNQKRSLPNTIFCFENKPF
jgi:tetratricopeptide (TPR) repeat protein